MGHENEHGSRNPEEHFTHNLELLGKISAAGGIEPYAESHVTAKSFIGTEGLSVCCSDERTPESALRDLGGPLFSLFILGTDRKKLAEIYTRAGVTVVTSHHECGAAKAAYKAVHGGTTEPTWAEVNDFARKETDKFAKEFSFAFAHIGEAEMTTDGHFHPGVCIYIDDVGGFSWRITPDMPEGYKVSSTIATDPVAGTIALLDLVAFGGKNAGVVMQERGIKFPIYIVSDSQTMYAARVAELQAKMREKPYAADIVFGMIQKPTSVPVRAQSTLH